MDQTQLTQSKLKEWADQFIGKQVAWRDPLYNNARRRGTVVDYKFDICIPPVGCFFVVERRFKGGTIHCNEIYKEIPIPLTCEHGELRLLKYCNHREVAA